MSYFLDIFRRFLRDKERIAPPERRVCTILIDVDMFLHILRGLSFIGVEPDGRYKHVDVLLRLWNGKTIEIPDDARVVGIAVQGFRHIKLQIESEAFAPLSDGVYEGPLAEVVDRLRVGHISDLMTPEPVTVA
jgi:hypothetical protein